MLHCFEFVVQLYIFDTESKFKNFKRCIIWLTAIIVMKKLSKVFVFKYFETLFHKLVVTIDYKVGRSKCS